MPALMLGFSALFLARVHHKTMADLRPCILVAPSVEAALQGIVRRKVHGDLLQLADGRDHEEQGIYHRPPAPLTWPTTTIGRAALKGAIRVHS